MDEIAICEKTGDYPAAINPVKNYKDMHVWQNGLEITDAVYLVTEKFPSTERFGLSQQMQRAAVSIPSNIAEGFCRQHTKEYKQFCHIALGSCAELETQLLIAKRRNYVEEKDYFKLDALLNAEARMLMKLIRSLRD